MTTRRYSEDDVCSLIRQQDVDVVTLSLKDRFGDLGMVGVCVLRYEETARIDTFLLSCRAFGRKAEDVLLFGVFQAVRRRGIACLGAEYIRTAKNGVAADFWRRHGFVATVTDGGRQCYTYQMPRELPTMPLEYQEICGVSIL